MSLHNIDTLRNMPESKLVFIIDLHYKALLKRTIISAMSDFHGIPLEWEDFYYEFLSEIKGYLKDYNNKFTVSTFLAAKCRFFVKNKCRTYTGAKHRLMNESVESQEYHILRDVSEVQLQIDLSTLNKKEMKVYQHVFLDGATIVETAEIMNLSKFKVTNIYNTLLKKLRPQVEKI